METKPPSTKEIAEFFRLGMIVKMFAPRDVVEWACSIVAAEPKPNFAIVELCTVENEESSRLQSVLGEVPGECARERPLWMLLGHASQLVGRGAVAAEEIFLRLWRLPRLKETSEDLFFEMLRLEDGLALARDQIYGTIEESREDIAAFLRGYEPYAPENLPESA